MTHATLNRKNRRTRSMTTALGPKPSTIQAILGYSKALQVVEAPPLGQVNLVLN